MTPRPLDVASVQAKLRSLDELGSALRLVGEVDADLSIVAAAVPVAQRDLADFVRQVASWLQRRG